MDCRQLRYFTAVPETGSPSQASERLNIASPALSHHIGNLEDDIRGETRAVVGDVSVGMGRGCN